MNPLAHFPDDWKTSITVTRRRRDRFGDWQDGATHEVHGCLVGWRRTVDPVDRADLTSDQAAVAAPVGSDLAYGDRLSIPDGPWPHGDWRVGGEPQDTPLGIECLIERGE